MNKPNWRDILRQELDDNAEGVPTDVLRVAIESALEHVERSEAEIERLHRFAIADPDTYRDEVKALEPGKTTADCRAIDVANRRFALRYASNEREKLREQVAELLDQLREKTKSFCTHCGKMFPAGREGLEQFKSHISECDKHPLHPMAKRVAELEQRAERAEAAADAMADWMRAIRSGFCGVWCPPKWPSDMPQPHDPHCVRLGELLAAYAAAKGDTP